MVMVIGLLLLDNLVTLHASIACICSVDDFSNVRGIWETPGALYVYIDKTVQPALTSDISQLCMQRLLSWFWFSVKLYCISLGHDGSKVVSFIRKVLYFPFWIIKNMVWHSLVFEKTLIMLLEFVLSLLMWCHMKSQGNEVLTLLHLHTQMLLMWCRILHVYLLLLHLSWIFIDLFILICGAFLCLWYCIVWSTAISIYIRKAASF